MPLPKDESEEARFTKLLEGIYERHMPTLVTIAKGIMEFKAQLRGALWHFATPSLRWRRVPSLLLARWSRSGTCVCSITSVNPYMCP